MTTRRDEPSLLDSLSRLAGHLFGMAQSRLELASLELSEARSRLMLIMVASFAAVLLFWGAVAALSAWVAVARLGAWVSGGDGRSNPSSAGARRGSAGRRREVL